MIIGIDGNEANMTNRVGIGEYAFELLKKFEEFPPPVGEIKFQIYLKKQPLKDLPFERKGWLYRIIGPQKLWTQIGLPLDLYVHKPRPDIFFTPTHYAPRFSPIPTAISIMDLSYMHFPEMFRKSDLFQLKSWTAYSAKKAQKIFTISKASKDDIIKKYNVSEDKIVVTYPGVKDISSSGLPMELLKKKYAISDKYILFVGTIQPRKNIERLIEAFSIFLKKINEDTVDLIIIGKKGWLYEEILNAPEKFAVSEKVKFLDFVSDSELPFFYKNAQFFILPSLYEGFGLPVLEAMKWGTPVITSNVSSLPEAGGDAALYVDPLNTEDIAEKMELLYKNKKLRQELIQKGNNQVKKFSWDKTAQQTLLALEELVAKK